MWLEEEEEDEVYHTTSYLICTLDIDIGGGQPDDDELIDQILQKQHPITMPLDELVKESKDNSLIDLCLVDPSFAHVKIVEFGPSKTLKINPSLSATKKRSCVTC